MLLIQRQTSDSFSKIYMKMHYVLFATVTYKLWNLGNLLARKASWLTSIESYEEYYKTTLHADLVKQYEISDMPGVLLSPRTYRSGDKFLVCTSCRWSTRLCKKTRTNPPKHSIANGFVIGHIPRYPKVHYPANHLPDKLNLRVEYGHGIQTVNESDIEFSDVFCAAFNSLSGRYKYVFGFTGGYEKELCGNYSITANENANKQTPWANAAFSNSSKVYCVVNGNMTSGLKCIMKETIHIKDDHYNHLLGWYILESQHPACAIAKIRTRSTTVTAGASNLYTMPTADLD